MYRYCGKTIKFMFLIWGHVAVKYFTEIVEFKEFLKSVSRIFFFFTVPLVNRYDHKTSYFLFLSLVMQKWNTLRTFRNSRSFLKLTCTILYFLKLVLVNKYSKEKSFSILFQRSLHSTLQPTSFIFLKTWVGHFILWNCAKTFLYFMSDNKDICHWQMWIFPAYIHLVILLLNGNQYFALQYFSEI